ncbi:ABC transporter G family member 28-like [Actinia tenebrosa]|uniref:ABC transporter G family member 28-like n=1 Tax=Actinia tenebrosa TaxID=6105 RepID=A0A6P8J271_ACTTE|nr:ABC transporter G family member 28-like [Actinia tenebrosa]
MVWDILFFLFLVNGVVVFVEGKCGDKYTDIQAGCCPDEYLHLCCPNIKPCNTNSTSRNPHTSPTPPVNVTAFRKPACMHPWTTPACQAGFYINPFTRDYLPCPEGFYCLSDVVCIIPCPDGAYCIKDKLVPASETSPNLVCREAGKCCEPSSSTPVYDKVTKKLLCPGSQKPTPCPEGNYCPNVTTKTVCPKGYFCRKAFTEPQPCPLLSACKKGSKAPSSTGAGVLFIVILFLIFIALIYYFRKQDKVNFYVKKMRDRIMRKENNEFGVLSEHIATVEVDGNTISPKQDVINLEFKNLSLTLKKLNKKVLQGVTGKLQSGEVTAIMGPSGCGKTTLLNTLSGKAYYGKREGVIKINGMEVVDLKSIKTFIGFVPQEDIMHRSLTIFEVLRFQAELRLPSTIPSSEKKRRVNEIIELLDLTKVKNTKIGDEETRGISGGQRKRVNIGMELVADPTLLFLDEPTSGLDSTSSLLVLDALRAVAEKGRLTVVCVIHQPRFEIFSALHKTLFLGPGGRTVYLGNVDDAEEYFNSHGLVCPKNINPADFYMDVIGGLHDNVTDGAGGFDSKSLFDKWEDQQQEYESEVNGDETHAEIIQTFDADQNRKLPGFLRQLVSFSHREVKFQFRLVKSLVMDLCLVLLAGGMLGALRRNATLDKFFILQTLSSLAIGLTAMLSSLRCFGNNRATFWRESSTGINRLSYFLAVNIVQLPIIIITPMVYLSLLYPLISPRGYLVYHYVATLAAEFSCTGTGYAISTLFNPKNSQMASVTLTLIFSLVSGLSPSLCDMNKYTFIGPLLYNLSFCRWYVEALFEKEAIRFPRVMDSFVQGLANQNGYSLDNYWTCIGVMFAFGIAYRVFAFIFLVFTNRGKQQ